ncbi:hypothetical protein CsSME_00038267 [Camellia sinensis var. sinensis]
MRNLALHEHKVKVTNDVTGSLSYAWRCIRVPMIVPPLLSVAIYLCAGMSIMLFVERLYMAIVILCVKLLGKKRYTKFLLLHSSGLCNFCSSAQEAILALEQALKTLRCILRSSGVSYAQERRYSEWTLERPISSNVLRLQNF